MQNFTVLNFVNKNAALKNGLTFHEAKLYKKAFKSFEFAAQLGSTEATYNLALYYLQGIHVKKDEGAAIQLLTAAASKKLPHALYALGNYYHKDKSDLLNRLSAFFLYYNAAKQNFLPAKVMLAFYFRGGLIGKINIPLADRIINEIKLFDQEALNLYSRWRDSNPSLRKEIELRNEQLPERFVKELATIKEQFPMLPEGTLWQAINEHILQIFDMPPKQTLTLPPLKLVP